MKIVGLIVEYNPLHNGHLHHIEESLRITGADKAIIVMSGDYVQRGAPAIMPKHMRAKMALQCGASMVIELPLRYATGSAEYFATGAVSILEELGCVDAICFGSESGNLEHLSLVAKILTEEPESFRSALQTHLKSGLSFPLARQKAMESYLQAKDFPTEIVSLLSEPNNILGIEYLKALQLLESKIEPYTITRKVSNYHDTQLQETHSSASAIRNQIKHWDETPSDSLAKSPEILTELLGQMPPCCHELMYQESHTRYPIYEDDFSLLLHHKLLCETRESLMKYQDMTVELANRIVKLRNSFTSTSQFTELIKTKHMTHARINRTLLHVLLNIPAYHNTESLLTYHPYQWNHYIHLLGFQKKDADILSLIKERSTLPIVTKLTVSYPLNEHGQQMLSEDIYGSNLYESVVTNKFQHTFIHELEKSLVLL